MLVLVAGRGMIWSASLMDKPCSLSRHSRAMYWPSALVPSWDEWDELALCVDWWKKQAL
jgi:hypothetical protein